MARLRAAKYDERLTLVEHLDELRTRIVVSIAVLVVSCGLCFWQNHLLLDIVNSPLPDRYEDNVLTFGVAEPFLTTLKVSIYAGVLLALPVLLYQAYAFVLPALKPTEKRVLLPFILMVPVLFIAGVVFAYYVVMPAALKFLLNFNDDQFNTQVRGSEYYGFFITTVMAVGLVFQMPIGILAVTRLGIVTPRQLAHNRRYAYLVIAVVAMLLPGTDPVTMMIEMVPLVVLFEVSVLLARAFGTPRAGPSEPEPAAPGS